MRGSHPWAALLALWLVTACGGAAEGGVEPPPGVPRKTLEIVAVYPHDASAWTQGLLLRGERLFESTGLRGRSTVREVDPPSGRVRRSVALPSHLFGEGLARVSEELVQLTWTSGIARVYDMETFALLREHHYSGEGWGLCFDGFRLVMSDGSPRLSFRDPATFALQGQVEVRLGDEALDDLNELECVAGRVYANVLGSDWIFEIDPATGAVAAAIDASGLLSEAERQHADVLNGIAYRARTKTFLLTGKLWPRLFEVRWRSEEASPEEEPTPP